MARGELTPQEIKIRKLISIKINSLIAERNITQKELSEKTGIPPSTITGYVKGTSIPIPGNIQKLADFFGVKKSDIDPRITKMPTNMFPINNIVKIPILGEIACGEPILAEENIVGYREEIAEFVPEGDIFFLTAKGDSMDPTIKDKSYVMIRNQPIVEDGEIAAVLVNGDSEATLKRVKHQGNIVMLMPDNPEYTPYIITKDNPARIIGKAIKVEYDL